MARVLIVEDDESLGRVLAEFLRYVQHEPVTARSLAEARAILAAPDRWDVVVADRMLPDGDGYTLGELCPRTTAFLTMTGQEHWVADLKKPFTLIELGAAIHRKLAETRG